MPLPFLWPCTGEAFIELEEVEACVTGELSPEWLLQVLLEVEFEVEWLLLEVDMLKALEMLFRASDPRGCECVACVACGECACVRFEVKVGVAIRWLGVEVDIDCRLELVLELGFGLWLTQSKAELRVL